MKNLAYQRTNVYQKADKKALQEIFDYAEGYKDFLNECKTEREVCATVENMAKGKGYTPFSLGQKLKTGDRVYYNNRGKNIFLMKMGRADIAKEGIRIIVAHMDSPRLDFKQVPLYEKDGVAFAKTHYYGKPKKYQWTVTPLSLHGRVVLADGNTIDVKIGEEENDPVFYISDLLPHLSAKQDEKPIGTAITGEDLNIWLGSMPYVNAEGDNTVKENLLHILNEKYGIVEADFLSAELSLVPAYPAKDVGFDRGLIGAYGHDDRVCCYPAVTALLDERSDVHTTMVVLIDKEEVSCEGTTGIQSAIFKDLIDEIASSFGVSSALVRANSKCLSADVNVAYDPNYPEVSDKNNATQISCGTDLTKFTGVRGKSGSNDTSAEYISYIRKLFDDNGVIWQTGELGAVDVGGGNTVAKHIAKMNIDTVDIGVGVISMHAPYEVVSKADVYHTYLAFRTFIKG